ncbi:MAG: TIGR03960 family B12-binding radical SAM protein, partial [Candidatus Sumerlaeota bacterium]
MVKNGYCMLPEVYEPLLSKVEKPGRYVGGERGSVMKDPCAVNASIALAFPDVYDIGMSYHGFRILYEIINDHEAFYAERVFTPWPDFADALRREALALRSLETARALSDFEIIGFTLQHELCYTNVLEMLDLGGIPLQSSERASSDPIVIAGGEGAWSPEPLAPFIDAFLTGDGEVAVIAILKMAARARSEKWNREKLLRELAAIAGVYVPSLYAINYNADHTIESIDHRDGAPARVEAVAFSVASDRRPCRPVVPLIRTVQSRTVIEVRRGCAHGCRFCQAGMLTRPVRERSVDEIVTAAKEGIAWSGDDTVSLLGLSTADHSQILPLVRQLNSELADDHVSVSLPSLRISAFDIALAEEVGAVRKSGFTFAPEAGSERLRRVINKPLDEADFMEIITHVLRAGWRTLKFYFMIGLPTETDEDLDGIVRIVEGALARAKEEDVRNVQINLTLSPFVPKAHTPFQWEGQIPLEEIRRRSSYVRAKLPRRGVAFKTSPLAISRLEAVLARGDRRLGAAIEKAWRRGCRFDAWSETFRPEIWWQVMEECGLDPAW